MYAKHNEQLGKVFKNVGEGGADGGLAFTRKREREREREREKKERERVD